MKPELEMEARAGVAIPALRVSVRPWTDWRQVAPLWQRLAQSMAEPSFFLGPIWTESWLEVFGEPLRPQILLFEDRSGDAAGACLLVERRESRGPIPVRRLYLNTAGEGEADSACVEHNDLLCRPGCEAAVAATLGRYLESLRWDEIAADGFRFGPGLEALEATFRGLAREVCADRAFYVDLAKLRESATPYESALSRGTRKHLRQYIKAYAATGELRVEAPSDVAGAMAMLDELVELHQRSWVSRGQPGSFASHLFRQFHRTLVRRAFSSGAIQLLRVTAGGQTVGVVYSFVESGKVSFYQSGLRYSEDRRSHPGMVTLAQVIQYCLARGSREFDFLAGEGGYKEWLSTDARSLVWLRFRRRGLKFRTIECLRATKRRLIGLLPPPARGKAAPSAD